MNRCFIRSSVFVFASMLAARAAAGELSAIYESMAPREKKISPRSLAMAERKVEHGITEIALETAPSGRSAVQPMTVKFMADGSVAFEGRSGAKLRGPRKGKLAPEHFNRLAAVIDAIGFADLDANYSWDAPNAAAVYTSVVQRGKRRLTRNYDNRGPEKLWAVEQLIQQTLALVVWEPEAKPADGERTPTPTPAPPER